MYEDLDLTIDMEIYKMNIKKQSRYTFIGCQKNKIIGVDLYFYPENDMDGKSLGFFLSMLEAIDFALKHKKTLSELCEDI